ncbi:acetyltransferase [Paenibacillus jiagnxiensis]|uniref:acetyltransferase n=1 Tax=Paenibacillus jiagnxiensis TaxID=3228926 RepID=UPI00339F02CE
MKVLLFGAGGHAKVVMDAAKTANMEVCGVVDDRWTESIWRGIPYLGGRQDLTSICSTHADAAWIVAIGDGTVRQEIVKQLESLDVCFATIVHPSACLGSGVVVGAGTVVMAGAILQADVHIGKHAIINTAATIDHDSRIGDYVHISPGVHLAGNVHVEKSVHIGIGACSIPGIRIGRYTIVGAGTTVIKDLPPGVVAVGCPARIVQRKERHDAD